MSVWRQLTRGLRRFINPARADQDVADEVQDYLDRATASHIARGLSHAEAVRAARRELGSVTSVTQQMREYGWEHAVGTFLSDLRYAARGLRAAPGFTAITVLTLALGIGANTAIFSIIDKLLLESLPVERPRELVLLTPTGMRNGWTAGSRTWSHPAYRGLRDGQRVFTDLIAERTDAVNMTVDGVTERVTASIVSGNYFEMLGVRALMGRLLSDEDDRIRSGHPAVVLSHGFWVERFGSRPEIVGQALRVGRTSFTVIGISEKGFNGLEVGGSVDIFVPTMMLPDIVTYAGALEARSAHIFLLYGRLEPGVGRREAEAQLQPLYLTELEQDVATMGNRRPAGDGWKQGKLLLEDGHRGTSGLRRDLETPLTAVMAMTVVLLLITCANLAGLQMARAAARMKEMAIRLAMGASRGRVVRQLLTESALIAALGALAGLSMAWITIRLLLTEMGEAATRLQLVITFLDARVLAFTGGIGDRHQCALRAASGAARHASGGLVGTQGGNCRRHRRAGAAAPPARHCAACLVSHAGHGGRTVRPYALQPARGGRGLSDGSSHSVRPQHGHRRLRPGAIGGPVPPGPRGHSGAAGRRRRDAGSRTAPEQCPDRFQSRCRRLREQGWPAGRRGRERRGAWILPDGRHPPRAGAGFFGDGHVTFTARGHRQ